MPQPKPEDRRPPVTPQMALRVVVLGTVAFGAFAIVFFRLWFLQVLSGEDYVSQARANRVRKVKIEAPRGDIVDRQGRVLVQTKTAAVVKIDPTKLPGIERQLAEVYNSRLSAAERDRLAARDKLESLEEQRKQLGEKLTAEQKRERARLRRESETARPVAVPALPGSESSLVRTFTRLDISDVPDWAEVARLRSLYTRLGKVIDASPQTIHERVVQQLQQAPYAAVTVKTDITPEQYNFLRERADRFPGVEPDQTYLRDYPQGKTGAHLFGTLGEISTDELKQKRFDGVTAGTRIGKSGLEQTYDSWLRGTDGYTALSVDAQGNARDEIPPTTRTPEQGDTLKLSLDLDLERTADAALQRAIAAANANGNPADSGAYVAMNPETGEVYALGSSPSYDAAKFAKPISQSDYDALTSDANGAPLLNRAIASAYPIGSTMKPFTALAALQTGILTPSTTMVDAGKFKLGNLSLQNAGGASFGTINVTQALTVSSDVFFYELGEQLNDASVEHPIQTWARRFGFGRKTGIDIPGESPGLVPDAAWRNREYAKYMDCIKKENVAFQSTPALYACGGTDRPWTTGDNVGLAIGQGDLQVTPLQLATAYSGLANGGKVVTPRLGASVEDPRHSKIQDFPERVRRTVRFREANRDAIMQGLLGATSAEGGTSSVTMKGFPYKVYGKTGTVQRDGQPDSSWYAAYVNALNRPIVIVVTVEKGGFGAEAAAPAARLMLNEWFNVKDAGGFRAGTAER